MDVKQAVTTAKSHVIDVFQNEGITTPTLEEVEFDDSQGVWSITVGFFRREPEEGGPSLMGFVSGLRKQYKVVRILDDDGRPVSIRNKDLS
jgi:hypothetical protein